MTDLLRNLLDERWNELQREVASASNKLRMSELPSKSDSGSLNVAVDHEGRRHLLVPLTSSQHVRTRGDGSALRLRSLAPSFQQDGYLANGPAEHQRPL